MRIAIIGQSPFAVSVLKQLQELDHEICGVFTIEDKNGREDALAVYANQNNLPLFKIKRWRTKGITEKDVFDLYKSTNPDLNVLPYCSQFIPLEVIEYPKYQSIVYHPSILPRHRGASAINWTLIQGDLEAGLSVFWADDGLDTGPILLQKKVLVTQDDTVDTLYSRFLYPEGVRAVVESVQLIATGQAPRIHQCEQGSTYDPMLNKLELQQLPLGTQKMTALDIHNFIRGLDKVPGAWTQIDGVAYRLYGSRLVLDNSFYAKYAAYNDETRLATLFGRKVHVQNEYTPSFITSSGLALFGVDGKAVLVSRIRCIDTGRMLLASLLGSPKTPAPITLTEEEQGLAGRVRQIFADVLRLDNANEVTEQTNFFDCGAESMDVTRLAEELKELLGVNVENDDIYMQPEFGELVHTLIRRVRSGGSDASNINIKFEGVSLSGRGITVEVPTQPFIAGEFVDVYTEAGSKQRRINIIDPNNEEILCSVQQAGEFEVQRAVYAAYETFHADWSKWNARDRGKLISRLAELMEQHKEQLAVLEALDSGAVYTLALKTHVGMSIDAFRYFAGWADKIHGKTVPINHNRPSRDLCIIRKEPYGVCALITPWNYPLMMVAWKVSAALAAGNCVVIKPPAVCPLTVLKLAELVAKAGFPAGVFNVLPGSGSEIGRILCQNSLIAKLAFTGSTEVGQTIMADCAIPSLKKVSLELGGKSPLVIFEDCKLDKAVRTAIQAVFFNKGENCIAAGRIFIHESIHDEFVAKLILETKKLRIGNPLERGVAHGPQNHLAHLKKLLSYIEQGKKEGAKLVYGGERLPGTGYYLKPTIFTHVKEGTTLATEESFGPIMCITSFRDIEEVLALSNNSEYGLAAGVFTQDLNKALSFSERIQAGTCFVNCYNKTDVAAPFGGFKQSGYGKDLGEEALSEYLKIKTTTIEY